MTICTKDRELWFEAPEVRGIAEACWSAIPQHFPNTGLDEWIVMPNHVHGIIVLVETVGAQHVEPLRWDECMRDGVYLFEIVTGDREFEDHAVGVMTR